MKSLESFSLEAQDLMGFAMERQLNDGWAPALSGKSVGDVEIQFKDDHGSAGSSKPYMRMLDVSPLTERQIELKILDKDLLPSLEQIEPYRLRASSVGSTVLKASLITEDLPSEVWAEVAFNEVTFTEKEPVIAGFRTFLSNYRNKRVIDSGFNFLDEVTKYVCSDDFIDPNANQTGITHAISLRKSPNLALSGFESPEFLHEFKEEMLTMLGLANSNKAACYMAMSGKPVDDEEVLFNLQLSRAIDNYDDEIKKLNAALGRVSQYIE